MPRSSPPEPVTGGGAPGNTARKETAKAPPPGNRRTNRTKIVRKDTKGNPWVDYKDVDDLRRLMTPNGKIYSRTLLDALDAEQRRVSQAIKRARYMGLLPYTSGTL